ncbi:WavE lipopolysaccharide synthesis family protein, partial [Lacticaseibacillus yichunensis]|uniref:WavE lipopolysaccharide synthesis family protein n=1 Tax=Lacticaseibacillus yichunensis TaxID=2486015 RepID=UPI001CDBA8D9
GCRSQDGPHSAPANEGGLHDIAMKDWVVLWGTGARKTCAERLLARQAFCWCVVSPDRPWSRMNMHATVSTWGMLIRESVRAHLPDPYIILSEWEPENVIGNFETLM